MPVRLPPGLLTCCCLGGAYHSGIELMGLEYAFGGHWDSEQGIFDIKPFYTTRPEIMTAYQQATGERPGGQPWPRCCAVLP